MEHRKPTWTTSSFLLYAGGLTVLGAAIAALAYLSASYGDAAYAGWALLVLAVLYALAHAFRRRGRWVAAGVFAFASVIAWGAFVGALWVWFGWLAGGRGSVSPFHGFSVARLSLVLLVLVAALDALRRFRFPFLAAIAVYSGWFLVTDLVSGGGSWSAAVTLLVGLAYLLAGSASDRPSAFWLHLAAGTLVGGSLLYWWHTSDADWALAAATSVVYVGVAAASRRSSWAVLGALGLLSAAAHFTVRWTRSGIPLLGDENASGSRFWAPSVVYAVVGFLLVGLGLAVARRRSGPSAG